MSNWMSIALLVVAASGASAQEATQVPGSQEETAEISGLDALRAAEARARDIAREAWDAAEAADAAKDAAEAELARLIDEAEAARQAANEAMAELSAAIGARQAAEAEEEAGAGSATAEIGEAQAAARSGTSEDALPAEEEPGVPAQDEERRAAEAALDRCLATAGPPSAEVPVSEEAQREALRALARARADCAVAAREMPDAGAAVYHLATIAQATGEHRQAVRFYERAAEAGVTAALTRLGDYYNFGIRPIGEDVGRAVELYEEATAEGDPAAAATLGMMHRLGRGVPRDPERMMELMRQAADAGYHFAQYRLAQTYLTGEGVPDDAAEGLGVPNPRAAVPLLAAAARGGNDEAAMELAELYETGANGVPPNPASRYRWIDFMAEKGDPRAIALRAFLIEQGIGTRRDPERAAAEYVRALETGQIDPAAMRGSVNGVIPRWDEATALAFQRILQERGLYQGALDAMVGPMTLDAARGLAE